MRKIIFLILFIVISASAKADTIYELIKIPNLEIYKLKTENKLRYLYAKKPFTLGTNNNINCYNSSKSDLDKKYKIIKKNLDNYSAEFLKKINLKYIVLCEDLSISGINTAGIPDNIMKTLILDIKFNEKYFERVIHHEVFHIINDSFKEIFNQNTWSSYNKVDFEYADCSTCTNKLGLDTYSNTDGFITEYSKSTISEDMAEIFSHIMTNKFPKIIDPILKNKINFIESQILLISN
ncbi:putative zinc-binding metallopeptidase [Candidatus Pelagibacter sp.]|jgi:hypothetical protein|nr:putative zinc-binding metallopeptidase [Candidatus Pelagibacter sp.]